MKRRFNSVWAIGLVMAAGLAVGFLTGPVTSFTWSSTTVAGDPTKAWAMAPVGNRFHAGIFDKTDCCGTGVWCVRGGHGHDGQ